MEKVTAIDWLEKELNLIEENKYTSYIELKIKQAKAMEKEQTLQFAIKAVSSAINEDINNPYNLEQLYNETFKSE